MKLPRGLLGFILDEGERPRHAEDVMRHVRGAMERIAAQEKCTLHRHEPERLYATYDIWRLHAGLTPRLSILVHRYGPFWTLTKDEPYWLDSDQPDISDEELAGEEAFGLLGWRRIVRAEAEAPITEEALSQLHPTERHEIEHWKASNIGIVLWNNWD